MTHAHIIGPLNCSIISHIPPLEQVFHDLKLKITCTQSNKKMIENLVYLDKMIDRKTPNRLVVLSNTLKSIIFLTIRLSKNTC